MSTPAPMIEIQTKISELESTILNKHPRLPSLLSEIHKTLQQYPECVTLLKPEEISSIIRGLESQTQSSLATHIVSGAKKSAAKSSLLKSLKSLDINDI